MINAYSPFLPSCSLLHRAIFHVSPTSEKRAAFFSKRAGVSSGSLWEPLRLKRDVVVIVATNGGGRLSFIELLVCLPCDSPHRCKPTPIRAIARRLRIIYRVRTYCCSTYCSRVAELRRKSTELKLIFLTMLTWDFVSFLARPEFPFSVARLLDFCTVPRSYE